MKTQENNESTAAPTARTLLSRISTLEWVVAGIVVVVMLVLVLLEPDILQAPFESARAIAVTFGGTALAAAALFVMLRMGVPPVIRVLVLLVPFVIVSWWLISPFFRDEVVNTEFSTSIAAERSRETDDPAAPTATTPSAGTDGPAPITTAPAPAGPVLLGSGTISGLAGHDGTGDAGIFRLEDGSLLLRLENLDIDNGPDLKLYLVPGADRTSPGDGSHFFGDLQGNVGNQTYEIPSSFTVAPGQWTVLVWCEAFTVEFVGATLTIT
jgi:hypothetical protein